MLIIINDNIITYLKLRCIRKYKMEKYLFLYIDFQVIVE